MRAAASFSNCCRRQGGNQSCYDAPRDSTATGGADGNHHALGDQAGFAAAVPFTREQLEELLARLSRADRSVDELFAHTSAWAAEHGFPWPPIAEAFAANEIASDGDVLRKANLTGCSVPARGARPGCRSSANSSRR
jgi:hypothetical protein